MYDTMMTVRGNVVDHPKLRRTKNGHMVANFRVASTPRRYDRAAGDWSDSTTLFVTVTAWRSLAENVAQSIFKGQPVVVFGRYTQHDYEQNEALRTAYELEADAVGHDLSRGVSRFEKTSRPVAAAEVDLDEEGIPADHSGDYLDLDEDAAALRIDPLTGEIAEIEPGREPEPAGV